MDAGLRQSDLQRECFINDSINIRRLHRFVQFRWIKLLRGAVVSQSAHNPWAYPSPSYLAFERQQSA